MRRLRSTAYCLLPNASLLFPYPEFVNGRLTELFAGIEFAGREVRMVGRVGEVLRFQTQRGVFVILDAVTGQRSIEEVHSYPNGFVGIQITQ